MDLRNRSFFRSERPIYHINIIRSESDNDRRAIDGFCIINMLGAICGSAISMDLAAQSMGPYSAQKSVDHAGYNLLNYRFFIPTLP